MPKYTLRTTHLGQDYATVEVNGVEIETSLAIGEAINAVYLQILDSLPAMTSIQQTNQGERGQGKLEIIKRVRKAIKEAKGD